MLEDPFPSPRASTRWLLLKLSLCWYLLLGLGLCEVPAGGHQWQTKCSFGGPSNSGLLAQSAHCCLLLSSQVAISCVLSRSCSYIHSERSVGVWLPHFIQCWSLTYRLLILFLQEFDRKLKFWSNIFWVWNQTCTTV